MRELKRIKMGRHQNPLPKREFSNTESGEFDEWETHRLVDRRTHIGKPELASQGPRMPRADTRFKL